MAVLPTRYDRRLPTKGPYSAIVYIDGSQVVAEDADGRVIASGVDGVDNTTVISTAIAVMTAGKIILIEGKHLITSTIEIPNTSHGLKLIGVSPKDTGGATYGTELYSTADLVNGLLWLHGTDVLSTGMLDHVSIENMMIDCGGSVGGIHAAYCGAIKLKNVWFSEISGPAISITESYIVTLNELLVQHCGAIATTMPAIYFTSGSTANQGVTIANCIFEPCYYGWIGGTPVYDARQFSVNDCYFEDESTEAGSIITIGLGLPNTATVRNCIFNGQPSKWFIQSGGKYIHIHDNIFYHGGRITDAASGVIRITGNSISSHIHDNVILGPRYNGISVDGCNHWPLFNIHDNTITYYNDDAATVGINVADWNTHDSKISNNIFQSCATGILIDGHTSYIDIAGNYIRSSITGINIITGCDYIFAHGNRFLDCATRIMIGGSSHVKIFSDNDGYFASGSSTGTGSEQSIAHGLVATPNKVVITPTVAGTAVEGWWADDANIHVIVTNAKTYKWSAEI